MNRVPTTLLTLATAAGLAAAGLAAPTQAAQPTFERSDFHFVGVHEYLTQQCGFEITVAVDGHIIERSFDDPDKGLVSLLTVSFRQVLTANGNTYRYMDAGNDNVRVTPDGTTVVSVVGQLPFQFTGALKENLDTGEIILEPRHLTADEVAEACAALAG